MSLDDLTDEELDNFIKIKQQSAPEKTNKAAATAMGFARGGTFGLSDEIMGALGAATEGVKHLTGQTKVYEDLPSALKFGYKQERDLARGIQDKLQEQHPGYTALGQVASALPQLGAKGAVTLANTVKQSALTGYGEGEGDIVDQAQSIGSNAALGAGLYGTGALLSKIPKALQNVKVESALKGLGSGKAQMRQLGENAENIAEYSLNKGIVNPFVTNAGKEKLLEDLNKITGAKINEARKGLPAFSVEEVKTAIANKLPNFNQDLSINAPLTSQLQMVENDLNKLISEGKISPKDLLDYKSSLFQAARKSSGEANPSKDLLEQMRKGIGDIEVSKYAKPEDAALLKEYAQQKAIEPLLENLRNQSLNSSIGLTGVAGSSVGAALGGVPGALVAGAISTPLGRRKIAETLAQVIHQVQKLNPIAQKLYLQKLDPRLAGLIASHIGTE